MAPVLAPSRPSPMRRRAFGVAVAVPTLRRPARAVLLWALGLGAGCADVLDVPAHPHLAAEVALPDAGTPPAPADDSATQDSATAVSSPPQSETVAPGAAREGGAEPLPLTTSTPTSSGARNNRTDAGAGGHDDTPTDTPPSSASVADAGTPLPPPPPDPCGTGRSLGPNGDCFAALTASLTWADARQSCRGLGTGWDLASILSADENTFVATLAGAEAWIGASDAQTEGTWVWVRDDRAFWRGATTGAALNGAYTNWNPGEPNGGANSRCARIVPDLANTWADLECGMLRPAVCEGPPPSQ